MPTCNLMYPYSSGLTRRYYSIKLTQRSWQLNAIKAVFHSIACETHLVKIYNGNIRHLISLHTPGSMSIK